MRKNGRRTLALTLLAAGSAILAWGGPAPFDDDDDSIDIALIGDIPYGVQQASQYPAVISDINRRNIEFTVHVGDIKAGSTLCDNSVYTNVLASFNTFEDPLIYLPGDNEWTDCHRTSPNNGGFDPLERLAFLRGVFYVDNRSLGLRRITLARQSNDPGFEAYKENVMWPAGSVLFVGLNIPGSNNGLNQTSSCVPANATTCPNPFVSAMNAEFAARNAANRAWLAKAFAVARAGNLRGVMVLIQANPNMDRVLTDANRTGFNDFIGDLRHEALNFGGKPVVLVHGDSHYVRIDKPLTDANPTVNGTLAGRRIENFTRVEVFGDPDAHWIKVRIKPNSSDVFRFEMQTVTANILPHSEPPAQP